MRARDICSVRPLLIFAGVAVSLTAQVAAGLKTKADWLDSVASALWQTGSSEASPAASGVQSLLLVSSPSQRKVAYVALNSTTSTNGKLFPLIDGGLESPQGLALTTAGDGLFVADWGAKKILHFSLRAQCLESQPCTLSVHGTPTLIAEGVACSYVATDGSGALYYSDQSAQSINVLHDNVIRELLAGSLQPSDLSRAPELELEALAHLIAANPSGSPGRARAWEAARKRLDRAVLVIHESSADPHLGVPAGIAVEDTDVFWANKAPGRLGASVASGPAAPLAEPAPDAAQASSAPPLATSIASGASGAAAGTGGDSVAVADIAASAYGLALTGDKVLFTTESHFLYGAPRAGGPAVALVDNLAAPRSVVWDGDGTVFVADEYGDAVYSLPSGRLAKGLRTTRALQVPGPFGLALWRPPEIPSGTSAGGWLR